MARMTAAERYAARLQRSLDRAEERFRENMALNEFNRRWDRFEPHYFDAWLQAVERYNAPCGRGVV